MHKTDGRALNVSESQLKRWLKEGKQLYEDWTTTTPLPKPKKPPRHLTREQADLHEGIVAAMSSEVAATREELISSGGKRLFKEKSPAGTIARHRVLHPTSG
jgi:hypothetical protein